MANNQEFEQCLELLNSSSDDAKFAALMLIPRFLQQGTEKNVKTVFQAMDFKFLERLMRTGITYFPMIYLAYYTSLFLFFVNFNYFLSKKI